MIDNDGDESPDELVRGLGERDLILVGFGALGIETLDRVSAVCQSLRPDLAIGLGSAEHAVSDPGPLGDDGTLPAPPAEASQVVTGPGPESVDVDLEFGDSSGGDGLPSRSSGPVPGLPPVVPGASPEALRPERVGALCIGPRSAAHGLATHQMVVASGPDPASEDWRSWLDGLWGVTQSVADEDAPAFLAVVLEDDETAVSDACAFYQGWQARASACGPNALGYRSACFLLQCSDGADRAKLSLPLRCALFALSRRDERRHMRSRDDLSEQSAFAVFALWAGDGVADIVLSVDAASHDSASASVGVSCVCLPDTIGTEGQDLASRVVGRFLDREGVVCQGFKHEQLARDRLKLTPEEVSKALLRAPVDDANIHGDLTDELRVSSGLECEYRGRRDWPDQLRNLRRLQIESTRPRLVRELEANALAWREHLVERADNVADDLLAHQVELPVARWAMEKLNETISTIDMRKAGWGDWAATGSRGDFDGATEALEESIAAEPFAGATVTRYLLAGTVCWLLLWLGVRYAVGVSLPDLSLRFVAPSLAVLMIVLALVLAAIKLSRARGLIIARRQAALSALDEWLVADLQALAADRVAKGLTALHAHIEAAIGRICSFTEAHEVVAQGTSRVPGSLPESPRLLRAGEPPLGSTPRHGTPSQKISPASVAEDFVRSGRRDGWRSMSSDDLRVRVYDVCAQASGKDREASLEAVLRSSTGTGAEVASALESACVVQAVPADPLRAERLLVVNDPGDTLWRSVVALPAWNGTVLTGWYGEVPLALLMKCRWSAATPAALTDSETAG